MDQLKETVIVAFRLDVSISSTCFFSESKQTDRFDYKHAHLSSQQSKLEKADILEMTVKHLQNIQTNKLTGKEGGFVCTRGSHVGILISVEFILYTLFSHYVFDRTNTQYL